MPQNAKILIVDDVPENISVLFDFLLDHNYDVMVAQDGHSALKVVAAEEPDLILLDVMMPGIDGFETCRKLKEDKTKRDIPVIFMTALSDTADKVKGLELGAVDFITKPIQYGEVLARINTQLTIRRQQQQLNRHNSVLERRSEEYDTFAWGLRLGLRPALHSLEQGCSDSSMQGADETGSAVSHMDSQLSALLRLVDSPPSASTGFEPLQMGDILSRVRNVLEPKLEASGCVTQLADNWPQCHGYTPWVEAIWVGLCLNLLEQVDKPHLLRLGWDADDERSCSLWVESDRKPNLPFPLGPLTPPMLNPNGPTEPALASSLLQLACALHLIRRHDGTCHAQMIDDNTLRYCFTLRMH